MRSSSLVIIFALALPLTARAEITPRPADQELGARLGTRMNVGGLGTGGVEVGGVYLYRITHDLWFDTRAQLGVGGGGAHCMPGRDGRDVCETSGVASGTSFTVLAGPRWFAPARDLFTPHVAGGVGVGYNSFTGDDLSGVSLPMWVAGGGRFHVRDGMSLGGEATLLAGPARYGRDQGWRGFVALTVGVTVEFEL